MRTTRPTQLAVAYLDFAKSIFLSNFRRLSRPYKLTLTLTYRCNLRCRYCRIWERRSGPEMKTDEIEAFFDRQPYFSWIDLGGGEVTLRSDLLKIIEIVIDKSPRILLLHFPTNGFLPDKVLAAARLVKRLGVHRFIISVSLDGPPALHDRLRGVEGSFEKALATFEGLRKREGVETYLGMTLGLENTHLTGETYRAVKKELPWVRETDFHFNLAQNSFYYHNLEEELSLPPELGGVLRRARRRSAGWRGPQKFLEYRYLGAARKFIKTGRCPLACLSLSSSCFIDPTWKVFPCLGYDRPLGNLRESGFDLDPIWSGPEARKVRAEIEKGGCPQCWTPCEAYQTILGNIFLPGKRRR